MIISFLLIAVGLAILIAGAEFLVRGAVSIANKFNISPLVIGLTIVSFGTSAPELTVNIAAALSGAPDLAIGNVVGSNIANILLILGICAVIVPLTVKSSTVWKEIPLALLAVILLFVMGNDMFFDGVDFNAITRTDGIVLMALMVIFMYYIVSLAKSERAKKGADDKDESVEKVYPVWASIGLVVVGLTGLVVGGRMLVTSSIDIAQGLGLSEALIGLTIVGVGTSLPELATSVVAALKKHTDIAIGNVVGSNIFNVFWILGLTSTILQLPFNAAASFDVLVAIGATLLLFIFVIIGRGNNLGRSKGILFLVIYAAYLIYIINRG